MADNHPDFLKMIESENYSAEMISKYGLVLPSLNDKKISYINFHE